MRDRKIRRYAKVMRRRLFRRPAEGCARRLFTKKSQKTERSQAKADIFATISAIDLEQPFANCEYCGVKLSFDARQCRGPHTRINNPHTVSVDAFVPRVCGGDYTSSNIRASCWACNLFEEHQTPQILEQRPRALSTASSELKDGLLQQPRHTGSAGRN